MATAATIQPYLLTSAASGGSAATVATASVTPTNGRIVIAGIGTTLAGAPNTPTVAASGLGASITFTQFGTATIGSNLRGTLFWALVSGSPSGAITFDFAGQLQTGWAHRVFELSLTNTSTPIVTSNTTTASNTSGTSLACTLPNALTAAMNRTMAMYFSVNNGTWTAGSSFANVGVSQGSASNVTALTIFGNDLALTCTNNGSAISKVAIGFEVSQDGTGVGGGGLAVNPLRGFVG